VAKETQKKADGWKKGSHENSRKRPKDCQALLGGERREMHSCYYGKINASFVRFVIGGSKAAILPFLVFFFS
jgi:hypothetical protein